MSKWDKYKVSDSPNISTNRWEEYKVKPMEQEGDSWGALIPKATATGALSLIDTPKIPQIPYELKFGGEKSPAVKEALMRSNLSDYNPDEDTLFDKGIEWIRHRIKPKPTTEAQRIASHAAEFAGANIIPGVAAAKGIKQIAKLGGMGAAVGGASGTAQELFPEVNPLVADIASSILVPTTTKIPALTARGLGLTGKNFNLQAAKHAKELGIDLPTAVLTENGVGRMAEEYLAKTPIIGKQIKNKYKKAGEQTQGVIEDILEQTGPKRTPEWEALNADLYAKARNIPDNIVGYPTETDAALKSIKSIALIKSPETKALLKVILDIKKNISSKEPIKLSALVETKQELNNMIKWDTPPSVKDRLKAVRAGVVKDIEKYKNTYPEWYNDFKAADENYAAMAKRAKAEKALVTDRTNYNTGEVNQNSLAKVINHPNSASLLEKNLNPTQFERLKKIGGISQAFSKRSKDILNPSGTTTTAATNLGLLYGALNHPIKTATSIGAGLGIKNMLTNQKWIDSAIQHAENPNLANNLSLNDLIKNQGINSLISTNKNNR